MCGYGAARKPQVARMVANLLGVTDIPGHDDVADACAVAVCHHHRGRLGALTGRGRNAMDSPLDVAVSNARAALVRSAPMIALVRGELASLADDHVVVDTGGVGYEVFCHLRTITTLHAAHEPSDPACAHQRQRGRDPSLWFRHHDELRLFRLLIGVERIGPKAALGILGRAELPVLVGRSLKVISRWSPPCRASGARPPSA